MGDHADSRAGFMIDDRRTDRDRRRIVWVDRDGGLVAGTDIGEGKVLGIFEVRSVPSGTRSTTAV